MLEFNPSRATEKFLKRLPPKHRRQVSEKILKLAEDPEAPDAVPLRGYEEYYRADIGEYRIIYRWSATTLFVPLIGKRNDDDVYRRLGRMMK